MVENQGPVEESERVESRRNEGEEEGKEAGMKMEGRMEEPEDAPGEEQRKVECSPERAKCQPSTLTTSFWGAARSEMISCRIWSCVVTEPEELGQQRCRRKG